MKIIKPHRKTHRCTQTWHGTREQIFPLLCPVRETDWIPDWNPTLVVSSSGVMEQDCLFVEPAIPNDAIWVVTHYDPIEFTVEMYRIDPAVTVNKLTITLSAEPSTKIPTPPPTQLPTQLPTQENTARVCAHIAYEYTALGEGGDSVVDSITRESFSKRMEQFNNAINHYLTTGHMINSH